MFFIFALIIQDKKVGRRMGGEGWVGREGQEARECDERDGKGGMNRKRWKKWGGKRRME